MPLRLGARDGSATSTLAFAIIDLLASLISSTTMAKDATQTVPIAGSMATNCGGLTPVLTVATTSWPASLMSETLLLWLLATQTVPVSGSAAMPRGNLPTGILAMTCPVDSLISSTLFGPPQLTQTVPVFWSTPMPFGRASTLMVATTACLLSLISETVLS